VAFSGTARPGVAEGAPAPSEPPPKASISLRLEAPDGSPVRDGLCAYVLRSSEGMTRRVESVKDATLNLRVSHKPPLQCLVHVSGVGYTEFSIDAPRIARSPVRVTRRLRKGATISGKVCDKTRSRPLGGIAVNPLQVVDGPGKLDEPPLWNLHVMRSFCCVKENAKVGSVSRDGDGRYRLENVPSGRYEMVVKDPMRGGREFLRHAVELKDRQSVHDLDFAVPLVGERLSLAVQVAKGEPTTPLARAEVLLVFSGFPVWGYRCRTCARNVLFMYPCRRHGRDDPRREALTHIHASFKRKALTNGEGRVVLFPVAPGSYSVWASDGESCGERVVHVGASDRGPVSLALRAERGD